MLKMCLQMQDELRKAGIEIPEAMSKWRPTVSQKRPRAAGPLGGFFLVNEGINSSTGRSKECQVKLFGLIFVNL